MVGLSKILTVSYGTFSCTLEGFDDSFDTMKDVAEYFRDLASDDRYFGAEPPTPDEEMLSRIAEREISRRVETRSEGSTMVLSAAAAAPVVKTAPVAEPTPEIEQDNATASVAAIVEASPEAEDVATDTLTPATVDGDEDASGSETGETSQEVSSLLAQSDPEVEISTADLSQDAADAFAEMSEGVEVPVTNEVPAHPDADSVAAKLQRIRAVVGRGDVDLTAGETLDEASEQPDDALTQNDEAEAEDDPFLSRVSVGLVSTDGELAEEEAAPEADTNDDAAETTVRMALPNIADILGDDATDDAKDDVEEDTADDAVEADAESDVAADDEYEEDEANDDAADFGAPVTARVIRMKRQDFDAAIREGEFEAEFPEASEEDLEDLAKLDRSDDAPVSSLSDEAEADLMKELAEVEQDIEADVEDEVEVEAEAEIEAEADVEAEAEVEVEVEVEAEADAEEVDLDDETDDAPARGALLEGEADEASMSRIMSETDEQLKEPEGNRRRNAIAHLKAAVAATEAARQMGDDKDPQAETENAFREDLDQVVRPRRAAVTGKQTARPRPAPLKLVASQRIDVSASGDAASHEPVAPRRVQVEVAEVETAQESDTSFAEYAASVGASELPELLEAAAAHTTIVEGSDEFSRIYLMKKVRRNSETKFSREDEMRHFGMLLRQGRITKLGSGRFQITDLTRFRPEPKRAQG